VYAGLHEVLAQISSNQPEATDLNSLLGAALRVGELNLRVMQILDAGHNEHFGTPEPTQVRTAPLPGKCILVSGHDLHDLESLLQQVEGSDINVYTHGEMLPAHSYPGLKKYKNLTGHYGGTWQLQKFEFHQFPGPIVMTTNCIIEPRKSYKDRIHTMNEVGWSGVGHVSERDGRKDFSNVIAQASEEKGFVAGRIKDANSNPITVGFGHATILSVADKVCFL
jgi:hydroxylamine reductase